MIIQLYICLALGLVGLMYLLLYEAVVMKPGLAKGGAAWVFNQRNRYLSSLQLPFSMLWPGIEEAIVRGIPLLLISNRLSLAIVLVIINLGFMLGHRDRDVIGNKKWLMRFLTGLVILIPAVAFHNLIGCYILHAIWNLYVYIRHQAKYWQDRLIIYSAGPTEVLFTKSAKPSASFRKLFPHIQTVRYH